MSSRAFKSVALLLSLLYAMDGVLVWMAHNHPPLAGAAACLEYHFREHLDDTSCRLSDACGQQGGEEGEHQPARSSPPDEDHDCAACRYLAEEPLPALPVVSIGAARPLLLPMVPGPESPDHPAVKFYHSRAPPAVA